MNEEIEIPISRLLIEWGKIGELDTVPLLFDLLVEHEKKRIKKEGSVERNQFISDTGLKLNNLGFKDE